MDTTTAPAAAESLAPSYMASLLAPSRYAPPWIQTITGIAGPPVSGVQTFRFRQAPSLHLRGTAPGGAGASGFCGASGPAAAQSSTPSHESSGTGGPKRFAPDGGPAYGMPRNRWTVVPSVPSETPRTEPPGVERRVMVDRLRRGRGPGGLR